MQGLPLLRYHLRVRGWLRQSCSLLIFPYARLTLFSIRDIVQIVRRHQAHGEAKAVSKKRDARFIITFSIFVSVHGYSESQMVPRVNVCFASSTSFFSFNACSYVCCAFFILSIRSVVSKDQCHMPIPDMQWCMVWRKCTTIDSV